MKKRRKNVKTKKRIVIIACLFFIIILVLLVYFLFFNKDDTSSDSKKSNRLPSVTPEKKINIVDMKSNKRPIAVMIDNNVGNSSHVGLQDAYISYEIIVEGGLTRIMALYKDKDMSQIGPIRSSRHYFLDYALESDAIYSHFGWSPYAENDIKSLGVNNINGLTNESAYWRDKAIRAPHNVFTSSSKLYAAANKFGYSVESNNWQLLTYSPSAINFNGNCGDTGCSNGVEVANSINIVYSNSQSRQYVYDSDKATYLRSMNNLKHVDKISGEQYSYKNIIIERVTNKTLDSYGRQDLDTVGTGDGFYITNGYARTIKWEKSSRKSKTKYKYSDGTEVVVNDGNTFIQIIPVYAGVTLS